jgi:hypothetical protein
MTNQKTIPIDDGIIPDGYRARVGIRKPGDTILTNNGPWTVKAGLFGDNYPAIILEKIEPTRRVFELVSGEQRKAAKGDWISLSHEGRWYERWDSEHLSDSKYLIWREVTEESK